MTELDLKRLKLIKMLLEMDEDLLLDAREELVKHFGNDSVPVQLVRMVIRGKEKEKNKATLMEMAEDIDKGTGDGIPVKKEIV